MGGDSIIDKKDIISTCIGVLWALGEKCQHCAEGRYFPEYRKSWFTYMTNPAELYAEKIAWQDVREAFVCYKV